MRKARFNLIFAACLAGLLCVTACGHQGQKRAEDSPPAAAQGSQPAEPDIGKDAAEVPPVAIASNAPVIVTFGDSLTAGVSGRSYPEQLQELLLSNDYQYRVDNQGVSGDTTTDGLARIDNVIAARPALVLLEFGGNDGLRGVPVESTRKNLDQLITRLQNAKLRVVLLGITLPPNFGPDYVKPFTAMYPDLAKKHKIPVFPFLLLHVYQSGELMQPDGIHPNGAGNKIVAQDVFNLIRPMLQKKS